MPATYLTLISSGIAFGAIFLLMYFRNSFRESADRRTILVNDTAERRAKMTIKRDNLLSRATVLYLTGDGIALNNDYRSLTLRVEFDRLLEEVKNLNFKKISRDRYESMIYENKLDRLDEILTILEENEEVTDYDM